MGKNTVLIGMMGSGKTTVGQLLAQRLRRPFVDTDALIEEREGRSIRSIFARDGEDAFRALELEVSRELFGRDGLVIACGGGLPMQNEAIAALKQNGLVFWLDRDPVETYDSMDLSHRPLAQSGRDDFIKRYQGRAPIYRRWSDHIIRAESPKRAEAMIVAIISSEVSEP